MTTALTIISATLRELGVIEAGVIPDGADSANCLEALNTMADGFLAEPNLAYSTQMVSAELPSDTQSLTIGPGQQINTARPLRLETGCFVRVGEIDYPLQVIGRTEYNSLSQKDSPSYVPVVCMYDSGSPTGNVYFWPTAACTVYLHVRSQLSQFADLITDYTLPPGYERFFKYALMEEIAGMYGKQLTQMQVRLAQQARRAVKHANFSVPQLNTTQNISIDQGLSSTVISETSFDGGSP